MAAPYSEEGHCRNRGFQLVYRIFVAEQWGALVYWCRLPPLCA